MNTQHRRPFRVALGLYVTPDFSEVLAGKSEPPWVSHAKVNFKALAMVLKELFRYGPKVTIRVPNDTIDQVTIHGRWGQIPGQRKHRGDPRCSDFGESLLKSAQRDWETVIDVWDAWQPLHSLKDRTQAPPPVILPFVIEAIDFEDAMLWSASAKGALGLPTVPPPLANLVVEANTRTEGKLPEAYRNTIGALFGCKFEEFAIIDRLATDKLPADIGALAKTSDIG